MAEPEFEAGQLLAGKYLVERVIGRGGMGSVVAAVHQRLNERVAIKILWITQRGPSEPAASPSRNA